MSGPLNTPRVVALDLALAATGLAWNWDHTGPGLGARTCAPRTGGQERVWDINVNVAAACRMNPDVVVIERPWIGRGGDTSTLPLAELHGVIKQWLWHAQIPYVYVTPATLKVYATGDGHADKAEVLRQVRLTYGHLFVDGVAAIADDDQCDALALLSLALDAYGHPLVGVPKSHRRAVKAVKWPALGEQVNRERYAAL